MSEFFLKVATDKLNASQKQKPFRIKKVGNRIDHSVVERLLKISVDSHNNCYLIAYRI